VLGVLGGVVPSILAGVDPLEAINHAITGGALGALAGYAAHAHGPPPPPPLVVARQTADTLPPTPRNAAPAPPPLPVLLALLVLGACTPSERVDAATAARAAVPACEATLTLLADAPELAPLCAAAPEVEAAVAELIAEYQASHGGAAPAVVPAPAIHRRVHARRHRTATATP
jgi:hypothetical protein